MIEKNKQFWYLYFALIIIVLIRLIPFIYPESRTWGFNHLIFLPSAYSYAFFSIATVALIIPFLKKSELWSERFLDWFSNIFFESPRRYFHRAIFISIFTVTFILFTAPTHFLGDGYAIISIVSSETGEMVKWSERGVYLMMNYILSFYDKQDADAARFLYQLVSYISGAVSLWFFFLIAQYVSKVAEKRVLILLFSVFSGSLLLFFGYVEHYPILMVFVTGYLFTALRFLKNDRGIVWALLFFIAGSVLHMLLLTLIPSIICLLLISNRWKSAVKRYKYVIVGILVTSVSIIGALFIDLYKSDLGVQDIFLNIIPVVTVGKYYSIFSQKHLFDILNELIVISPLIPLLFLGGWNHFKPLRFNKTILFLISVTPGFALFLLIVDPKIGMARDWDLFSIPSFMMMLILLSLISEKQIVIFKKVIIAILILLMISILPFLVTNLNEKSSASYSEYLISLDFEISRPALFIESKYYENKGNKIKAESLKVVYKTSYPRWNKCESVAVALQNYDISKAQKILNTIEPKLYDAFYQKLKGRLYYLLGDYDKSLTFTNNAIELAGYLSSTYAERAEIYFALDSIENGFIDLHHGYKLNNEDRSIIDMFITAFSHFKQFDSSIYYCHKRLAIDSASWPTYYELSKAYAYQSDILNAQKYAAKMAEFNISHIGFRSKLDEVTELIINLKPKDENE